MTSVCHGVKRFESRADRFRSPGGPFLLPLLFVSRRRAHSSRLLTLGDILTKMKQQQILGLFEIGKMVSPAHGLS